MKFIKCPNVGSANDWIDRELCQYLTPDPIRCPTEDAQLLENELACCPMSIPILIVDRSFGALKFYFGAACTEHMYG